MIEADPDVGVFEWGYDQTEDDSTAWGLTGGMMFNDYVGLQLTYRDYGSFSDDYALTDEDPVFGTDTLAGTAGGELDAVSFSVLGSFPISDAFSVYGSLGLANWNVSFRDRFVLMDDEGVYDSGALRGSDDGTGLVVSLGALVHLSDYNALGLEFERLDADASVGDLDVDVRADTLSATLVLRL